MNKIIFYECILLFSSVLVFRALWAYLDRVPWLNTDEGLAVSLIIGIIVSVWALEHANRCMKK